MESMLLREEAGGEVPRLCLRTRTRVDAGGWLRRVPLWLCVLKDEVVLLAVHRRRFVQRVKLRECAASEYCHASGEMVLKPVEGLEFGKLAMSPADALKFLEVFRGPSVAAGDGGRR